MEVLDTKILTIQDLHNSMEGATTTSMKDFLIYGSLQWDDAMVGQPYRANAAAFIFCTGGSATISAGLREFNMHKNSVMLYGPGNIINVLGKSSDFTVRVMLFSREFTHGALLDINAVIPVFQYLMEETNDLLELNDKEASAIDDFFSLAVKLARVGNNAITVHLLSAMFLTVSDMYAKRKPDTHIRRNRQEEYFERFMIAVSAHHRNERSVQFYADELRITPKYLSTVIKEVSGRSAAQWIDEFVIQEAKVLLKFSNKSIQEIAYHLNFSTQSFFGKYFKRHTGMSPNRYRKV